MSIRNCAKCGKLFHFSETSLCDKCKAENEVLFKKIKNFIENNPNCNILEISKKTGISKKYIFQFIKNGQLETYNNSDRTKGF